MDGLLIDTEPVWRRSHVEVNAKHGYTITEDDVRQMAGRRTDEVVRHWVEMHDWQDADEATLIRETIDKVIAHVKTDGQALAGVYDLLKILKAHHLPIAIASSSPTDLIAAVIARLELQPYITMAHSGANEKFGKPHPAVFLTTAKELGIPPEECLVFEDSVSGVQAAKAAGMKCIAVPEPINRKRPEYDAADLVVDSLEQVDWQTVQLLYNV